jgi:hypothetical protein
VPGFCLFIVVSLLCLFIDGTADFAPKSSSRGDIEISLSLLLLMFDADKFLLHTKIHRDNSLLLKISAN